MNRQSLLKCLKTLLLCWALSLGGVAQAHDADDHPPQRNDLVENGVFIQIPGPNPLLTPGPAGAWDSDVTETADAFKDFGTYHLYYHATGPGTGYQLGVATSDHPLGPFKKYGNEPIVKAGPEGSWDSRHAACAMVLKEGLDRYYMWYSGWGGGNWDIGLATASSAVGPWKKHEDNPIMDNFGYVGGVVKVEGKYYMYNEHPIGQSGPDYGPMSLAIADSPQGPWKEWHGNPVLLQGEWGEWDDGAISEAEVLYHSGVFHCFYGGTKLYRPRIASRESIGYAYSFDGINFIKYGLNPIVTREANPNAASYSEVHAIFEAPYIYLYHTLRYKNRWQVGDLERVPPGDEDLGVQVLITQRPFSFDMPLLMAQTLKGGQTTTINNCPPLALSHVTRLALTTQATYSASATRGLRIHIRSSHDGYHYDTTDIFTLQPKFVAGQMVRQTIDLKTPVRYIKLLVENADDAAPVSDLRITATLGG